MVNGFIPVSRMLPLRKVNMAYLSLAWRLLLAIKLLIPFNKGNFHAL